MKTAVLGLSFDNVSPSELYGQDLSCEFQARRTLL